MLGVGREWLVVLPMNSTVVIKGEALPRSSSGRASLLFLLCRREF
jgi:hypothetical protein